MDNSQISVNFNQKYSAAEVILLAFLGLWVYNASIKLRRMYFFSGQSDVSGLHVTPTYAHQNSR